MKRLLSLLLTLVMAASLLCACSDDSSSSSNSNSNNNLFNLFSNSETQAVVNYSDETETQAETTYTVEAVTQPEVDYSDFGFNNLGTMTQWAIIEKFDLSSPETAYALSASNFCHYITLNTSSNTIYLGKINDDIIDCNCVILSNDNLQFDYAGNCTLNITARKNYHNILVLEVMADDIPLYMIPTNFLNFYSAEPISNGYRYTFKDEYLNW